VNRRRVHVRSTVLLIGLLALPAAAAPPVPEAAAEIGEKIYFEDAGAEITPASSAVLDAIAGLLRREPERFPQLALEGHAAGNEQSPMRLSLARSSAVRLSLIQRGVDGDRLFARASGATVPACRHDHEVCWERERRVEFAVLRPSAPPGIEPQPDAGAAAQTSADLEAGSGRPARRHPADPGLIDQVTFARGSALLRPSALPTLDLVAGFLKATPSALAIEGHASADERHPDELARARAQAVRAYLIACGVGGEALAVRSEGSAKPACAERSPSCRAANRRVEVRFSEAAP
jgi:outer membrane protein OmpA-like peptidoglycan-associated protein